MNMTAHRVLALIKSTEDRLQTLLREAYFFDMRVGQATQIRGESLDSVERRITTFYHGFESLYGNLIELKCALAKSNAGIRQETDCVHTKVTAGMELTVSEIIIHNKLLSYRQQFLERIENQYKAQISEIDDKNEEVTARCERFLMNLSNNDKSKLSPEEVRMHTDSFMMNNSVKLFDPLHLAEKLPKWKEELEQLRVEYDAALSEENALTVIEVKCAG